MQYILALVQHSLHLLSSLSHHRFYGRPRLGQPTQISNQVLLFFFTGNQPTRRPSRTMLCDYPRNGWLVCASFIITRKTQQHLWPCTLHARNVCGVCGVGSRIPYRVSAVRRATAPTSDSRRPTRMSTDGGGRGGGTASTASESCGVVRALPCVVVCGVRLECDCASCFPHTATPHIRN